MTDKVPARVIVHRLTKEQQQRLHDQTVREKKKGMKYSARSKRLSGINIYRGILYVGKSRFYLKHGNHSFIFIIVKR
ncbi:Transposase for insertion sequence element IS231B [Bacillus thuringiensis serovar tochigiensis BGSC 4Y1]|nr:Transposase for insertion sequence element IS231B [Bacillus thuringiensis serovar tochigiensis BGSC 4Y1]